MELARRMLAGAHPSWVRLVKGDAECPGLLAAAVNAFAACPGPVDTSPLGILGAFTHVAASDCCAAVIDHHCLRGAAAPLDAIHRGLAADAALRGCMPDPATWMAQGVLVVSGAAAAAPLAQRVLRLLSVPVWDTRAPPPPGLFRGINATLLAAGRRPVSWLATPTVAATDGGCRGNGTAAAAAGYGACILAGPLSGFEACGPVLPYEYELVDPADPAAGFCATAAPARPSNNRAEYLAMCHVLLAMARARLTGSVEILCDSKILVMTIREWLPARKKRGKAAALKNYDLVRVVDALHAAVAAAAARVTLTHVNSHQAAPPAGTAAHARWYANDRADRLAARGIDEAGPVVSRPFWAPGCA